VYINEAHAADGRRPKDLDREKGIDEHKTYEDRCTVAWMLAEDKTLTIPFVIDTMDKQVETLYRGLPNRLVIIRKDGRIGLISDQGARGYESAIPKAKQWLTEYEETGKEPEIK
jgi:hypothetical protein